ncbi:MAG: phosphopantothenoylcysteine decarboxylase [Leptospiraceae bacterium]|nr:phosphopantothenoylcysteine decarboxylase [Leptospiraceae bacterium]
MRFKKIIVTAGPTKEWIDPVRYISNASSGKMGFLIATEMLKYNQNTVYIYGGVTEKYSLFQGQKFQIETTQDLLESILEKLEEDTLIIMAAAPADFKPTKTSSEKIKKNGSENLIIELTQNPDILKTINQNIREKNFQNVRLIGFAAETNDLEKNAEAKLLKKGLDFIVGNYVGKGQGFGEVDSSVKIFSAKGLELEIINSSKEIISSKIVSFILNAYG